MSEKSDKNEVTVRLLDRVVNRRRAMASGVAALAGGATLLRPGIAVAQDVPATSPGSPSTTRPDKGFDFKDDNALRGNDPRNQAPLPPGEPGKDYNPVVIPNGWVLP